MGGNQFGEASSGVKENLLFQESSVGPNNTNDKRIEIEEWGIVEWFSSDRGNWQDSLFKWIILALEEPMDSKERQVIEKGLNVLKREIGEIFMVGISDEARYNFCFDILKNCHDYIVTQDTSVKELIKDNLLKRIFEYFKIEFTSAKSLVEIIRKISISKRSVLRFMTHQSIQARVAYLRTALITHQKPSDMEGYHCTTNPYYHESSEELKKLQSTCMTINSERNELLQRLQDLESKLADSEKVLNEQIEMNAKLVEEKEQLSEDYKSEHAQLTREMDIIRNKLESAKREATVYQAALGNATNVRWSDDSFNNPIQLTKDIQEMRQLVDEFTKVKGKAYAIKEKESLELLKSYDNRVDSTLDIKQIKTLLSFALQRMVLKIIFDAAERIYDDSRRYQHYNDSLLEPYIVYHAEELIKYSSDLAHNREGNDSIAGVTPIKIRQQIYASLALRGYSKNKHPYIRRTADEIIGKIKKYREIVDEERQNELRSETESLIRTGFHLWFSLKAQEPAPKIKWCESGVQIKTPVMEGSWDTNQINDLEVSMCYFPLIATDNKQVYCKASVVAQPKAGRVQKVLGKMYSIIM
ncbi:1264_t:CDS:1 [Acaulospora colombiana]|uniref:1264_t:CDS:1 n=1 Tax=Acaulospora colombiana TaxID=27376 RepID=A0ACA9K8Q9_9GLOM|nr:1264_t:CDS:1 [Acaulospora colombiana]